MEPRTWLKFLGREVHDAVMNGYVTQREYREKLRHTVMEPLREFREKYEGRLLGPHSQAHHEPASLPTRRMTPSATRWLAGIREASWRSV